MLNQSMGFNGESYEFRARSQGFYPHNSNKESVLKDFLIQAVLMNKVLSTKAVRMILPDVFKSYLSIIRINTYIIRT